MLYNKVGYPPGGMGIFSQVPGVAPSQGMQNPQLDALNWAMTRMEPPQGPAKRANRTRARFHDEINLHKGSMDPAAGLEKSAKVMQLQALMNPQPLRMVGGPGVVPGYTPDTLAMNSFQRKAYLPDQSVNAPDRDAAAENIRKQTANEDFDAFTKVSGADPRKRDWDVATFGRRGRIA